MRIDLNLASEPFRRDRPFLVGATTACVLLSCSLAALLYLGVLRDQDTTGSSARLRRVETELANLDNEQKQYDAVLRKPDNSYVLDRSLFLNSLLVRKGISWTRIFQDMQSVLPPTVRLISIRPQLAEGGLYLDMQVAAQTPEPVVDFLLRLEKAPQFGPPSVSNSLPPSQTDPFYRYRVSVTYAQKL